MRPVANVTDPLFSKHVSQKENIYFNDLSYASSAEGLIWNVRKRKNGI